MAGFKGKYEHTVDDKGRVSLPSKIRKSLNPEANDSFVITRGYENSLVLYRSMPGIAMRNRCGRASTSIGRRIVCSFA
jgi:AbrB family looped-hinge helix DNA binding protein